MNHRSKPSAHLPEPRINTDKKFHGFLNGKYRSIHLILRILSQANENDHHGQQGCHA
jgi:hypothetical protein